MTQEAILLICKKMCENTLMETLEIEFVSVDLKKETLTASMPVTPKVHQPDGVLHGGATAALAESVGSAACYVFLDAKNYMIRGIEISANHLKSKVEGMVYATASFIHKGRTTQLWDIKVVDEEGKLISQCKLSTITLPKKK
ncbi:thioesterase [Neptunitalea chrysea]|uniref:Thioesterase n=1 Tax=Neptunitalea chrysea TaxID=1647581 RepID=A0A9W6B604_9FLAO|nr:hotdog fold thioesterase [Neptunitalea chrysea]GLB52245.1 thioesterase [Neptunitalea chrysea]